MAFTNRTTYCATLLILGDFWKKEQVEDLLEEEIETSFGDKKIPCKLYVDGEHLMIRFKSAVKIPLNTYYIDAELDGTLNDATQTVEKINSVLSLSVTPLHADQGAIPINKYEGRF